MLGEMKKIDRPARDRVAARVKEMICNRGLQPGEALPSYLKLTRELDASLVTVKLAFDDLAREGVVRRIPSRGTFVAKAIAQVSRELKHVGVIYPSSRQKLFSARHVGEIMRGIALDAPPAADTHIFSLREDGLIRAAQLGEWCIDGAVLLGVENDDYLRSFAQWGTPGVVVDYCSQAAPLDYVACDNAAAAQKMVAHLASLGHRRVAYVADPPESRVANPHRPGGTLLQCDSSDRRERREESWRALRDRDIQVEDWTFPEMNSDFIIATAERVKQRIRSRDCPTAVLTSGNRIALWLLKEIAARGLRVPEDISVCTVASDADMAFGEQTLTGCRFDFTGMGRKAIAVLAERRRTRPLDAPRVHRIGFEFVEGQTSSAPL